MARKPKEKREVVVVGVLEAGRASRRCGTTAKAWQSLIPKSRGNSLTLSEVGVVVGVEEVYRKGKSLYSLNSKR